MNVAAAPNDTHCKASLPSPSRIQLARYRATSGLGLTAFKRCLCSTAMISLALQCLKLKYGLFLAHFLSSSTTPLLWLGVARCASMFDTNEYMQMAIRLGAFPRYKNSAVRRNECIMSTGQRQSNIPSRNVILIFGACVRYLGPVTDG